MVEYIHTHGYLLKEKKINKSLNVLKCVSAFAVICIHCSLYASGTFGIIIDSIIRFAVPVFFLISGYYSYFKDKNKAVEKYKIRIIKLIKLLIISNLLYFTFDIIINNNYANILDIVIKKFGAKEIFSYIVLNVSPTSGHLWFIGALLYCYIIYFLMSKFEISHKKLYKYIPILLIANIMIGEIAYHMRIYNASMYYRNFLFTGLPFFVLGYLINDKQEKLKNTVSNKFILLTLLVSICMIIMERLATGKIELHVGTIGFSVIIFIWCVLNPEKLNLKVAGWIGEKLYTNIYILQGIVIELVRKYEKSLGISNEKICYVNIIIVFIITTTMSCFVYFICKIIKRKFNKIRLYS